MNKTYSKIEAKLVQYFLENGYTKEDAQKVINSIGKLEITFPIKTDCIMKEEEFEKLLDYKWGSIALNIPEGLPDGASNDFVAGLKKLFKEI